MSRILHAHGLAPRVVSESRPVCSGPVMTVPDCTNTGRSPEANSPRHRPAEHARQVRPTPTFPPPSKDEDEPDRDADDESDSGDASPDARRDSFERGPYHSWAHRVRRAHRESLLPVQKAIKLCRHLTHLTQRISKTANASDPRCFSRLAQRFHGPFLRHRIGSLDMRTNGSFQLNFRVSGRTIFSERFKLLYFSTPQLLRIWQKGQGLSILVCVGRGGLLFKLGPSSNRLCIYCPRVEILRRLHDSQMAGHCGRPP